MPQFRVTVSRGRMVVETADITISAATKEEAEKQAVSTAEQEGDKLGTWGETADDEWNYQAEESEVLQN